MRPRHIGGMIYSVILASLLYTLASAGHMHPNVTGWDRPGCDRSTLVGCAPSYAQLENASLLWDCPSGAQSPRACGCGSSGCTPGAGSNPLCAHFSSGEACCCPRQGCYATPEFNQIIGVCRGNGCACGGNQNPSCAPEGRPDQCGNECSGASVPCCFGADVSGLTPFYDRGSQVTLNYMAAYQFNESIQKWVMDEASSFNANGSRPPFDLMKPYVGSRLCHSAFPVCWTGAVLGCHTVFFSPGGERGDGGYPFVPGEAIP